MAYIEWTRDLETGFQDIDEQHKQMVAYINELYRVCDQEGGCAEQTAQTLFDLISCTVDHFAYEEEMLEAAGYALTGPHKNTHSNFTAKLMDFQNRIVGGETVSEELLGQLDAWIFRHIRLNDHGYVDAVRASGIYEQDEDGLWQRTVVEVPSVEEAADAAAHTWGRKQDDDDDAPKSWATGAY